MIDDTAPPKTAALSAGVARRYCGHLGRKANGRSLVSLSPARGVEPSVGSIGDSYDNALAETINGL